MTTFNKSLTKIPKRFWHLNNYENSLNTCRELKKSDMVQLDTQFTINRCRLDAHFDHARTNDALFSRIKTTEAVADTLEFWTDVVEKCMSSLTDAKDATERLMKDMQVQEDCNTECLLLRDRRRGIDYTEDNVEAVLREEKALLEANKSNLLDKTDMAFNELLLLQEARQKALKNIQDKKGAIKIDTEQYKLQIANATFKRYHNRVPKRLLKLRSDLLIKLY